MNLKTFNYVLLGLLFLSALGYIITDNRTFIIAVVLFGSWYITNFIEFIIARNIREKPVRMEK